MKFIMRGGLWGMVFTDKKIHFIVSVYKWFYLSLVFVGVLLWYLGVVVVGVEYFFNLAIILTVFIGLKFKKSWTVLLMVLFSIFLFFNTLVYNVTDVGSAIVRILAFSYAVFTIYFFTKKETRKFFGLKGTMLF